MVIFVESTTVQMLNRKERLRLLETIPCVFLLGEPVLSAAVGEGLFADVSPNEFLRFLQSRQTPQALLGNKLSNGTLRIESYFTRKR